MTSLVEIASMLFDNFILYTFLQAMLKDRKKPLFRFDILFAFLWTDLVYWLIAERVFASISSDATIIRTIFTTLITFFLSFFYTSGIFYKFFVSISYTALAMLCENLAYYIIANFVDINIDFDTLPPSTFTAISLISDLLILLFSMIITALLKKIATVKSRLYSFLLVIIPLLSCIMAFLPSFFRLNYTDPPSYLCLIFFLLLINIANYVLLQNVVKAESLAQEKKLLKQQILFQKNKYQQLSDAYKNIRGFMHDTKKHLFFIEKCVNEKQYDKIVPYTKNTLVDLESRYCAVNTGNLVIDAFISNAILQSKSNGIKLSTKLNADKNLIPCDDYHMAIILGNLLDNAMTACTGQAGSEIKIHIQIIENSFVIHIANTYHLPPYETPPDNFDDFDFIHGYGLKNVKTSAEMCDGFCMIKYAEGIYSVTVVIPLKEPRQIC